MLTEKFPDSERFSLTSQLRRASVSIPSNIAEGYGRSSRKERHQFVILALGSASEIETQLIVAKELGLIIDRDFVRLSGLLSEIMKMLTGLSRSLS